MQLRGIMASIFGEERGKILKGVGWGTRHPGVDLRSMT